MTDAGSAHLPDGDPLILTLALDDAARERFDALRRAHFPAARNVLTAHVTAFHALPAERLGEVLEELRDTAPDEPVDVRVTGVRFLGRGVAYELSAPPAEAVRARLADQWRPWLTAQDAQRWRPHVTVQNKVAPGTARALHTALAASALPGDATATGWDLFRYRGGPWEHVVRIPFGEA